MRICSKQNLQNAYWFYKKKLCSNCLTPSDLRVGYFEVQFSLSLLFPHSISEKGDIATKTSALKKVMYQILNGERMPGILMTIIRFVLPLQDHTIKKLLLIFWEIVPKTQSDGKLLHEMILVCDAYRKVWKYAFCFNMYMLFFLNVLIHKYIPNFFPHISLGWEKLFPKRSDYVANWIML